MSRECNSGATVSLGRHKRTCSVCRHPQRAELEAAFIDWRSPAAIAEDYGLTDRASVYRHAHALGLFEKRRRNIRAALERIIEKAGDVDVTASAVVSAVQAYAKINGAGEWIDRTEIPSDKARYGSFYLLAEEAEKAVHKIIEEAASAEPGTEERKFGDVYASFMDEKRIEQLGARPLKPLLNEVDAIATPETLLATAGRFERRGMSGFFQLFIDNDPGDPERYLVFF